MTDRARTCGACGALNGADFGRCVRCGAGLSPVAGAIDRLRRPVDGEALLATKAIFALTSLVFALQIVSALGRRIDPTLLLSQGGHPADLVRFGALYVPPISATRTMEPWRLLSAVFVHGGFLHVAMNMLTLGTFGRMIEPVVGSARFLACYVLTGVAGFAATVGWALARGAPPFSVGASGAILGIMGMILGLLVRRRDPRWKSFAVRALFYGVVFGLILNLGGGFGGAKVDNAAHIGGLSSGFLVGLVFAGGRVDGALPARGRARSDLAVNLAALCAALACVASLVLAQTSPRWRRLERRIERVTASAGPSRLPASPGPGAPTRPLSPAAPIDPS